MDAPEKPLAGKRIVVTRAPEQARELTRALEQLGAEVLLLPAVCFERVEDPSVLDRALLGISGFDWLLFTSQNAVRFFCQRSREIGRLPEGLPSPKLRIGAVGAATAQAIVNEGMRVDYIANDYSGRALAQELGTELDGRRVLLPRSDRADQELPKALRDAGAIVTEAVAYRTVPPTEFDSHLMGRVRRREVDAIIFVSPSAFYNFRDALGATDLAELSVRLQFAAIGRTTARALRGASVHVAMEAQKSTSAGIAAAIANYYQREPSNLRRV